MPFWSAEQKPKHRKPRLSGEEYEPPPPKEPEPVPIQGGLSPGSFAFLVSAVFTMYSFKMEWPRKSGLVGVDGLIPMLPAEYASVAFGFMTAVLLQSAASLAQRVLTVD